jgi:two-component system, chemotaxis family, protein-glutamate methylesterase/glutaminase
LRCVCAGLPADLEAAVLVVQHTSGSSLLPQILTRAGPLPAVHPEDKEIIQKGRIYVAPPDFHMIVRVGRIRLFQGARENRHRPAIDPLFRSAANSYGPKTVGVVLTGLLDDGTSGLMTVKAQNGAAVVQDPASALFPSMPASALEGVPDAHVAPLAEIPQLLVQLVNEQVELAWKPDEVAGKEVGFAELDMQD